MRSADTPPLGTGKYRVRVEIGRTFTVLYQHGETHKMTIDALRLGRQTNVGDVRIHCFVKPKRKSERKSLEGCFLLCPVD
jgi:hypothetical protein